MVDHSLTQRQILWSTFAPELPEGSCPQRITDRSRVERWSTSYASSSSPCLPQVEFTRMLRQLMATYDWYVVLVLVRYSKGPSSERENSNRLALVSAFIFLQGR